MPVNDLVPHMNTAENYSYSKVIFCIRGVLASKKIQRVETANGSKVAIKELGMLNMTFIIVSVGSFTNRRRKTIFHVHNPIIGYIAIFAKLNKNVRVVTNLHNDWKNFSIYQKIGLIFSFYASSKIIAVSDYIHSTLPKILRRSLTDRKILTVHNSIEVKSLQKRARHYKQRNVDLVIVGRIVPQKNWRKMLRVINYSKNLENVVWFGSGYEFNELTNLVTGSSSLRNRITLKGNVPRSEVIENLCAAKIYMALSKWEGIGVANLEAIACGCYPVLSDIGPHTEIKKLLNLDMNTDGSDRFIAEHIDQVLLKLGEYSLDLERLLIFDRSIMIEKYWKVLDNV